MFASAKPLIDLKTLPEPLLRFATVAAPEAVTGIGNLLRVYLSTGNEQAFHTARAAARVYAAVQGPEGGAGFLRALEASPCHRALNLADALLLANEIDCGVVVEHLPLRRQAEQLDAEMQWDAALAVQEAGLDLGLNPEDHPRLRR